MLFKIGLVIGLIGLSLNGIAQDYEKLFYGEKPEEKDLPFELLTQIKHFDDFAGRFNGLYNAYGYPIDTTTIEFQAIKHNSKWWNTYRLKVLGALVSEELWNKTPFEVETFLKYLVANSVYIDFIGSNWLARLPFELNWKGQRIFGHILLSVSSNKDGQSWWIIQDCIFNDPGINLPSKNLFVENCSDIYIPPSAQDNGFIAVKKMINSRESLSFYVDCPTLGLEQLNHILTTTKDNFFFSNPEYIFHVDNDHSFGTNSYWQIKWIESASNE